MKQMTYMKGLFALLLALPLLAACNKSEDDGITPEPDTVTTLDLTVTGADVQAPAGNVYLFYSEDISLSYATGNGDGTLAPIVDVSTLYHPVVRYQKDGVMKTLNPVSAYGTLADGKLDTYSSVRYSQVHFDITKLDTAYGTVQKNSEVLVVIVLNDPQTKTWVTNPLQLRRNYLIHVSLPDNLKQTYIVGSEQNAKWWQVEE